MRRRPFVALRPARLRYRTRAAASTIKPLILAGVVGAGVVWGAGALRDVWGRTTWTRVQSVAVLPEGLRDGAPPEGFSGVVGVSAGDSLWGFSAGQAAGRLETQFPELSRVRVRRTWDRRVEVRFQRRRAAAKVWEDGQWLGMDEEGGLFPLRVFAPEDAPPDHVLPEDRGRPLAILAGAPRGPAARPFLELIEMLRRQSQSWSRGFYKMKLTSTGETALYLKDGPLVLWGDPVADEALVAAKAARLERVLRDPRAAGAASVRFVDDRRLAVKLKSSKENS